jgi:hypothetical protein
MGAERRPRAPLNGAPEHLERLFQTKLPNGTVLTRQQLLDVRASRPVALDGGLTFDPDKDEDDE